MKFKKYVIEALGFDLLAMADKEKKVSIDQVYEWLQELDFGNDEFTNNGIELKPCPFCGGRAKITEAQIKTAHGLHYAVRCTRCKASISPGYDDVSKAVDAWNIRRGED